MTAYLDNAARVAEALPNPSWAHSALNEMVDEHLLVLESLAEARRLLGRAAASVNGWNSSGNLYGEIFAFLGRSRGYAP